MSMRRVFVVRKDLNLKPGKLGAMIGHLCEAYWTNQIKKCISPWKKENEDGQQLSYVCNLELPIDIVDEYVFGPFTKTICEVKNLNQLNKKMAEILLENPWMKVGEDYGYINDNCQTDLVPENQDGTTTIGVWFRPIDDIIAGGISHKFKLFGAFDK